MSKKKKRLTKKQMRRRKKKILIIELVVLLVLLGLLAIWMKFGMIDFNDLGSLKMNNLDEETNEMLDGYTNIALFGVDNRSNGNTDSGNSDCIIVASINNDTKEVKLLSVYRDTCLNVGSDSYRKCNYAYAHGGAKQAIEMLNQNLDLNIEEYVTVDFNALVNAVDAVGGVEVDVDSATASYINPYIDEVAKVTGNTAKHVSAGNQTLDGVQATAYCRIRYTAGGDLKRAERQREVVTKVVEKAQTMNPATINKLINAIFPEVSTSLSATQMIELASAMRDYKIVDTHGFPFDMKSGTYGKKGSLDVPCTLESNVKEMYAYLFNDEEYDPSDTVKSYSNEIQSFTGCSEDSAVDYGF